ncbi:unnamed protein product [Effrenium voratum]|nr:unnamed protein product [Effrenium voratum]
MRSVRARRPWVRCQGSRGVQQQDPRTELAKANSVPVGVLQLPRSRGERLQHLEILDRVPFDLVTAYHEREAEHGRLVGAARGPIGKILRRHRKDSATTLIHTMLKACVEKRWDPMLWDTFGEAALQEVARLGPADIGLILFCCMKADYRRDTALVPELLKRLSSLALAGGGLRDWHHAGHASGTLAKVAQVKANVDSGRKHRSSPAQATKTKADFPQYALLAGMAAVHHFGLSKICADDLAKIAARALQSSQAISSHVLCRLVHHAGGLLGTGGSGIKFLQGIQQELSKRIQGSDITPSHLCLVAHTYAQAPVRNAAVFQDVRDQLDDVALLQLSIGELANVANAFAKLSDAAKCGNVELLDRLGRQLLQASQADATGEPQDTLDLRNACVVLNAFAQAALRHEPFFVACEERLPVLLHCGSDVRQLSMIAHAYVRVGLSQSCLLPLIWDRATRLAPHCDAQGVSLMIFAVTKAAASEAAGVGLVRALTARLLELLTGESAVPPQTVVVCAYALAKSGFTTLVDPAVWNMLAGHGQQFLGQLSLTEVANLAAALAEVAKSSQGEGLSPSISTFFRHLSNELNQRLKDGSIRTVPPAAASKLIVAFGEVLDPSRQLTSCRCWQGDA